MKNPPDGPGLREGKGIVAPAKLQFLLPFLVQAIREKLVHHVVRLARLESPEALRECRREVIALGAALPLAPLPRCQPIRKRRLPV